MSTIREISERNWKMTIWSLPYYMIPAYFIKVDKIPMLANGKMNRRALPKPVRKPKQEDYVAPRTQTERILCEAFEKALQVDRVGIHDNFYHLGGDSLGTMRVLSQANLEGFFADRTRLRCLTIPSLRQRQSPGICPVCTASPRIWTRSDCATLSTGQSRTGLPCIRYLNSMKNVRWCSGSAPEKMPKISVERISEAEFQARSEDLQQPFTMVGEPLIHAGIYQTEEAVYLFFEVHHIMTDGTGMHLLNEDIVRAFDGKRSCWIPVTHISFIRRSARKQKYWDDRAFLEKAYGQGDWCFQFSPDVSYGPPDG